MATQPEQSNLNDLDSIIRRFSTVIGFDIKNRDIPFKEKLVKFDYEEKVVDRHGVFDPISKDIAAQIDRVLKAPSVLEYLQKHIELVEAARKDKAKYNFGSFSYDFADKDNSYYIGCEENSRDVCFDNEFCPDIDFGNKDLFPGKYYSGVCQRAYQSLLDIIWSTGDYSLATSNREFLRFLRLENFTKALRNEPALRFTDLYSNYLRYSSPEQKRDLVSVEMKIDRGKSKNSKSKNFRIFRAFLLMFLFGKGSFLSEQIESKDIENLLSEYLPEVKGKDTGTFATLFSDFRTQCRQLEDPS